MSPREHVTVPGPEGSLESVLDEGGRPGGAALLLCHPHPQYGGDLDDGVLEVVARAWAPQVATVLRFNFRGVGGSSGAYDGGRGEVADVEAAAAHLATRGGDLWLGGYSFGSAMAWLALRSLAPPPLLLVAPPLGRMAYPERPGLTARVDVIVGSRDPFVDREALTAWAPRAGRDVRVHVVDGADHFFGGREAALAGLLRSIV